MGFNQEHVDGLLRKCAHDKGKLSPGPWTTEPDRAEFFHAGLPCVIQRVPELFHLCGYVGVPPGHPLHGRNYNETERDIEVHGGLTFSDDSSSSIGQNGQDDHWWFGFDCAHLGDFCPYKDQVLVLHEEYRDIAYVKAETCRLADQLAAIK